MRLQSGTSMNTRSRATSSFAIWTACLPGGAPFSLSLHDPAADACPRADALTVLGERIAYEKLASALLGKHNMLNIGVAYGVCKQFGVPLSAFGQHLKTYRPLPHRLELVGEVGTAYAIMMIPFQP